MYTYVDANTLQVRIYICLYVSVVQATVNMPHPTQPQPHAWRSINFMTKVQANVNMPHPTLPNPHPKRFKMICNKNVEFVGR